MDDPKRPESSSDGGAFKPDIVSNIPLHQATPSAPVGEDHEFDKIMQDVGHQLNQEKHKPTKKHHFFGRREPKSEPKLVAQPVPREQFNMSAHSVVPKLPKTSQPPDHRPAPKPQAVPKSKSSAPVMVILLTIIVTGILIVAAISAYK
ncbi:hypothetical protein KW801_01605 [Candidatus Saccharibacteria bacterium]|nr:hypothetical protein [Candidatus Saccharibacteria bacterium]